MSVDRNIIDAVNLWITKGISPGSFTTLMLQGKYAEAIHHAHPMILPHFAHHILYFESLPKECRGVGNMKKWNGTEVNKKFLDTALACDRIRRFRKAFNLETAQDVKDFMKDVKQDGCRWYYKDKYIYGIASKAISMLQEIAKSA